MEKVFASVRSPLEISVAVARTSQSPFPLSVILNQNIVKIKYYERVQSRKFNLLLKINAGF